MKMLQKMLSLAAVAVSGAVLSAYGAVQSGIVGYTTLTIDSKYQIIGVNFQAVDSTSLKLNDLIPYQEGMTKGNNAATADQIQIGNETGGWDIYYMSNGKNGKGATVSGLEGKWAKSGQYTASTVTLKPGDSFWYVRNDETKDPFTLSIAGSVSSLPTASFDVASKYRIFANPYPAELPLNGGAFSYDSETMTAGNNATTADQIQIGDNAGAWTIYYLSNGKNGKGATVAGLEGKWSKSGQFTPTTDGIPVGKAAWYVRKNDALPDLTVTVDNPLAE